jgi:hypothetical protein
MGLWGKLKPVSEGVGPGDQQDVEIEQLSHRSQDDVAPQQTEVTGLCAPPGIMPTEAF